MEINLLDELSSIAQSLELTAVEKKLNAIKARALNPQSELVLPLIGEFSSGKTTLLSSLMDSKMLEIQIKPTTATIYTIHFSSPTTAVKVLDESNKWVDISVDGIIKNDDVKDAHVVNLFDTSTKIPASTVLVDTPGLSSGDPKHKEALVEFLPYSDGAILVVDINSQITKTLVDFVQTMKLANRPLYLVITKIDTKSQADVDQTKELIAKSCKIDIQQVACISAPQGNLEEFYYLIKRIDKDKKTLIEKADSMRVKSIIGQIQQHIQSVEKSIASDHSMEDALSEQELELRKINQSISSFIDSANNELEDISRCAETDFNRNASTALYDIVSSKSANYDAECVCALNSLAALSMEQYRNSVRHFLQEKAIEYTNKDSVISPRTIEDVDLTNLRSDMNCQFNLNGLGHEYDDAIAIGGKVIASAAAVATVVATAGAATSAIAGTATATTAGTATAAGGMSVTEGIIEGAEIITLWNNKRKIEALQKGANISKDKLKDIEDFDNSCGQKFGQNNGIVKSLVGFVTDKVWGKPQRQRAIAQYMNSSILPEFRTLSRINRELIVNSISDNLRNSAKESIDAISGEVSKLRANLSNNAKAIEQRRVELKGFKATLQRVIAEI